MQEQRTIASGRLSMVVGGAQARALRFDGLEVLRGISAPVRDENWGTMALEVVSEEHAADSYLCRFHGPDRLFYGTFRIGLDDLTCTAEVELDFARQARLNRAGFCLLHPIAGVAGTSLTIRHPDGRSTKTEFPALISPSQPARDIAGLSHQVHGVPLDIALQGDVFEMEDQRNWSDASFKTYCRPLALPRPFDVAAGEVVRQRVVVTLDDCPAIPAGAAQGATQTVVMPQVMLAHESSGSSPPDLDVLPAVPILARVDAATDDASLAALAARSSVALELVVDRLDEIGRLAARLRAAGLRATRVVALPRAYLKSHQPEGPWPDGPTPADCVQAARAAFPGLPVGGGSLTNFTEFNRCRPGPDVDFVTFGNTAIVHAADDTSVCQTLEALPAILASAKATSPGKPLQLGLFSIGMRSNPYGTSVQPNPDGRRIAMAGHDPRQATEFAAAYALAVLAIAASKGVASLALAMLDGPLGAAGRPLARVVDLGHRLAGQRAEVEIGNGVFRIRCGTVDVVANLPPDPVVPGPPRLHIAEDTA